MYRCFRVTTHGKIAYLSTSHTKRTGGVNPDVSFPPKTSGSRLKRHSTELPMEEIICPGMGRCRKPRQLCPQQRPVSRETWTELITKLFELRRQGSPAWGQGAVECRWYPCPSTIAIRFDLKVDQNQKTGEAKFVATHRRRIKKWDRWAEDSC
jgi:hypothetical protein